MTDQYCPECNQYVHTSRFKLLHKRCISCGDSAGERMIKEQATKVDGQLSKPTRKSPLNAQKLRNSTERLYNKNLLAEINNEIGSDNLITMADLL